jgi:hypothetical protein
LEVSFSIWEKLEKVRKKWYGGRFSLLMIYFKIGNVRGCPKMKNKKVESFFLNLGETGES